MSFYFVLLAVNVFAISSLPNLIANGPSRHDDTTGWAFSNEVLYATHIMYCLLRIKSYMSLYIKFI